MYNPENHRVAWLALTDIDFADKTYQYRRQVEASDVADLVASFKESGQEFPILVREMDPSPHEASEGRSGRKQLICGFRRFTAAKELGWEKVMAIVVPQSDLPDEEAERLSVDENMKRKSLTNLDIMFACKKLKEQGDTYEEIAKLIGKDERSVRRYIGIAGLPQEEQDRIKSGEVPIRDSGTAGTGTRAGFKNMLVKSTKSGFNVILKYNRKKDDVDTAIAFLNKVLERLKEEKGLPVIKHILIEGRARGKAGDTLELILKAYDKNQKKIDPALLNPQWDSSDAGIAEISNTSGTTVKIRLKTPGTCFLHAQQGNLKSTAGIEVLE